MLPPASGPGAASREWARRCLPRVGQALPTASSVAKQHIMSSVAKQQIVSSAAKQHILSSVAKQHIMSSVAKQHIMSCVAKQHIMSSLVIVGPPIEAKSECMYSRELKRDSSWLDQRKVVREIIDEESGDDLAEGYSGNQPEPIWTRGIPM